MIYRDLVTRLRFSYGQRDRRLLGRYERDQDGVRRGAQRLAVANNALASSNARVGASFAGVGKSFAGLGAAFGVVLTGKGISDAGNALDNLENRIRSIEGAEAPIRAIRRELTLLSQENFANLEDTAQIFQRFRLGTQDLGRSRAEIIDFTDLVQKSAIVSGSTPTETNNALIQFAQGIASNRFSGEEFRSVSEQIPTLIRVLKTDLGITTGELRERAFAGDLTADVIFEAFTNQREQILKDFGNLKLTRALGVQQLRTGFTTFFGAFAQGSRFNEDIAQISGLLGNFFTENEAAARRWGSATVGAFTIIGDAFGSIFGGAGVGTALASAFGAIGRGLDQAQRFLNVYQALRSGGQSSGVAFDTSVQTIFGKEAVGRMRKLLEVLKPIGQAFAFIFASRAVAGFALLLRGIATRFGPIGAAVTVITLAMKAWNAENSGLKRVWMELVELWQGPLGTALRAIGGFVGSVLAGAFKTFVAVLEDALGFLNDIINAIAAVLDKVGEFANGIAEVGKTAGSVGRLGTGNATEEDKARLQAAAAATLAVTPAGLIVSSLANRFGSNQSTTNNSQFEVNVPLTVNGGDPNEVRRAAEEGIVQGLRTSASGAN